MFLVKWSGGWCFSLFSSKSFLFVTGLRPGLVQKYQSARTAAQKFELLRAFLLDPDQLSSLEIEAEYIEQAAHDDQSQWVELPLCQLRRLYSTPEEAHFLQTKIVDVQHGRNHPQDPHGENGEMKLYWVFREATDTLRNRRQIGHKLSARGEVPRNKAAVTSVGDGLVSIAAGFAGKGDGKGLDMLGDDAGGTGTGKGKSKHAKTTKQPGKGGGRGKGSKSAKAGVWVGRVKLIFSVSSCFNFVSI